MDTLTIDKREYEIDEDVSSLILTISKERDELKKNLLTWITGCEFINTLNKENN